MTAAPATRWERTAVRHELRVREARVSAVADLGPRLRRVVLRLEDGAAAVPWVPGAVGTHVKLAFPHPRTGDLALPTVVDGRPVPGPTRPVLRDYTVRAVPDEQHVVVELVVHGEGPASSWAAAASPGSVVGVLGPRGSVVEPTAAGRYLCLGDESALPALARWLEEAPATSVVDVAVQVPDATGVIDLPTPRDGSVSWLVSDAATALADHLADALAEPAEDRYVWAAGEAGAMVAVRQLLRDSDLPEDRWHVDGYWRQGVAGRDHHAPLES
ncbi:siderophore-interacting protein [Ornithinicoccus halotolerans]|uniref:siderophore-interacting protein n=1 Tax=Ornithinicoccus halotolerans TaxID=1748220 RepID=UPI0012976B64|nr:siderophore-interacting protein [Ornithinicoccus halotolerans]